MNKRMIVVMAAIAISGIRAAQANPLQIAEARAELTRINASKSEAKATLDKAKLAYKALDQASDRQARALELLIKADQAKQAAERNSVSSVANGRTANAYYADQGAASGAAKIIRPIEVEYEAELPAYLRGS